MALDFSKFTREAVNVALDHAVEKRGENGEGDCWCDDWGDDYQSPESDPAFYIQRVGFAGNPAGGGIFHTRSEADAGRYVSELLYSARNGDMVTVEISL